MEGMVGPSTQVLGHLGQARVCDQGGLRHEGVHTRVGNALTKSGLGFCWGRPRHKGLGCAQDAWGGLEDARVSVP